jgi:penicillin-binding protein A
MFGSPSRAGTVLLPSSRGRSGSRPRPSRGRRGGGRVPALMATLVALAALAVAAVYGVRVLRDDGGTGDRRLAAQRYATAWAARDHKAMWRALDPATRTRRPQASFVGAYDRVERMLGVRSVRVGRAATERSGAVRLPVALRTARFGTLRGTVALPVSGKGATAGVVWRPELRLPGLRRGEVVRVVKGAKPTRGVVETADGSPLDADPLGASIVGVPAAAGKRATGLERVHDARLAGHPSERLRFGRRTIASIGAVRGRSVTATIRPALQRAAASALGSRLGGVAVIRPSDGAVLALAGLAVSAPQPPGSTFKIITLATALEAGIATPRSSYPVRTSATLSGTELRNASDESCGGTLPVAFAESCNSVFAPLGAKLGAKRLIAAAEDFGFNQDVPAIPALKRSTIATDLRDDLAVGASAIGQDRDLATPLEMASVGATIANDGRRVRPRLTTSEPKVTRRVVSARIAHQVRAMMLGVVRSGTGTAAALPGVQVAGKTGTAELRPTAGGAPDPKNTDAWFVAFAPAGAPKVAVAVMLVGAGAGGAAAAPIARQVLQAALG